MECPCCGDDVEDVREHLSACPEGPSTTSMTPDWTRFDGPLFGPGSNARRRR